VPRDSAYICPRDDVKTDVKTLSEKQSLTILKHAKREPEAQQ